jgi:hypothetical protein
MRPQSTIASDKTDKFLKKTKKITNMSSSSKYGTFLLAESMWLERKEDMYVDQASRQEGK